MQHYILRFPADDFGEAKAIEFESDDAHEAFFILAKETAGRHVALYQGDNHLGVITRATKDRWVIEQ